MATEKKKELKKEPVKTEKKTETKKESVKKESSKTDALKKDFDKSAKKIGKTIENNILYFIISILCFIAGLVMWVLFKDKKETKNRSIACLYGSMIGAVLLFIIGFVGGALQIV